MNAKKSKKNSEPQVAGKPVSASRSEMAEVVLPAQTNPLGKLLGGHVMHLVDIAAIAAAMSTRCITCPPSSFPSGLVCAGSTTSAISERDALTGFPAT